LVVRGAEAVLFPTPRAPPLAEFGVGLPPLARKLVEAIAVLRAIGVVGRQLARTMPRVRSISLAVLLVAESHGAVVVRVDSAWESRAPSIRSKRDATETRSKPKFVEDART
jgi:hypothetical protein